MATNIVSQQAASPVTPLVHDVIRGSSCPNCGKGVLGLYNLPLQSGRSLAVLGCPECRVRAAVRPYLSPRTAKRLGLPGEHNGHTPFWYRSGRVANRQDFRCSVLLAGGSWCPGRKGIGPATGFVAGKTAPYGSTTRSVVLAFESPDSLATASMLARHAGLSLGQAHGALKRLIGREVAKDAGRQRLVPKGFATVYELTPYGQGVLAWFQRQQQPSP